MKKNNPKKNWKVAKSNGKWITPYVDHPSDKLRIRPLLDEKIKGNRIICLEARIKPGQIHQLHFHENEFVIVYTISGNCKVTVGDNTQNVRPRTIIFIPPKVPHRFENKSIKLWEGVAFAVGDKTKIKNIWMD